MDRGHIPGVTCGLIESASDQKSLDVRSWIQVSNSYRQDRPLVSLIGETGLCSGPFSLKTNALTSLKDLEDF